MYVRMIFRFVTVVFICLVLVGCQSKLGSEPNDFNLTQETSGESRVTEIILEKDVINGHYSILKEYDLEESTYEYRYLVYDAGCNLVLDGSCYKQPFITSVSDDVILVKVNAGPMNSANWGVFYNFATQKKSEVFHWILDYTEETLVLGNPQSITVRNIFDDNFVAEFNEFVQPIAQVSDGILEAVFVDDNTVSVTYVVNESYDIVSQNFSLYE